MPVGLEASFLRAGGNFSVRVAFKKTLGQVSYLLMWASLSFILTGNLYSNSRSGVSQNKDAF